MTDSKAPRIWKEIAGLHGERIVLLDWEGQSPKFVNLLKLDRNGQVIWQVQPAHPLEGCYSGVRVDGQNIIAYNEAGYSETIDYSTGKVLKREFTK